ncbi:MAG: hypothetical protein IT292_08705 [Deltaproteobacteria bacterium]|nr:hypothetical protein [Deltaproteobacteria bacterium]
MIIKFITALLLLAATFYPSSALAISSPEDTVSAAITVIKNQRRMPEVVNYVYWPSAFERLSQKGKKQLKVYTPDQFRNLVYKFLADPANTVRNKVNDYKNTLTPAEQVIWEQPLVGIGELFAQKALDTRRQLQTAGYQIGAVQNYGQNAVVILKSTIDGKTTQSKLKLVLINGKWLFSDIALAEQLAASLNPMNELGKKFNLSGLQFH